VDIGVLVTASDSHLGGRDFDDCLLNYYLDSIEENDGVNLRSKARPILALKDKCQAAKCELSQKTTLGLCAMGLINGDDFEVTITPEDFERVSEPLFDRSMPPVDEVLKKGGAMKEDITDVLLSGGSSLIPKI
jgi:L1 cell adhesion molecule like protein